MTQPAKFGNMREQSMYCNLKKILYSGILALAICLQIPAAAYAQGDVTLQADGMPTLSNDSNDFLGVDQNSAPVFPESDDIQLPSPDGMISPQNGVSAQDNGDNAAVTLPEQDGQQDAVPLENNLPALAEPDNQAPVQPQLPAASQFPSNNPLNNQDGNSILSEIDNELFSQMSDLERQTALLTLELRREKIKNEIEAIKATRQKALDEEQAKKEEKEKKRIEWEKEQEAKILREKKALKETQIRLEKLRQQKVLKAYKENMLHINQDWIDNNAKLYERLQKLSDERDTLAENIKSKLKQFAVVSAKTVSDAETARDNYKRQIENLQTQISILKARLEAEIAEKNNAEKTNPFAQAQVQLPEEKEVKLSDEYVIMEIRGKGENLIAKLINRGGDSFLVKKGTALQTGHLVDEITQTYLQAVKNGVKDYLYFSAGGILEREPEKSDIKPKDSGAEENKGPAKPGDGIMTNNGIPSLGDGMFVK